MSGVPTAFKHTLLIDNEYIEALAAAAAAAAAEASIILMHKAFNLLNVLTEILQATNVKLSLKPPSKAQKLYLKKSSLWISSA